MRISDWSSDVCSSDLAAGTEDTDAVNKSQLDEVAGSVGELTDTVVQYDDEDKDTVTLAGEEGTAIGNVAAGSVSATSMDAINGGQLYRSEEHTSELQSLMRISYAVFCLKKKTKNKNHHEHNEEQIQQRSNE